MSGSVDDACQSLARIVMAATRLSVLMCDRGRCVDPEEELDHIQANLNHVRREVTP